MQGPLQVAEKWFDWARIDDGITLLWEPHVDPLIRCNIWHVRGGSRDLVIDSGLGMASLVGAARAVFERPVTALATHSHYDHIGGFHEFDERIAHRLEGGSFPSRTASLRWSPRASTAASSPRSRRPATRCPTA